MPTSKLITSNILLLLFFPMSLNAQDTLHHQASASVYTLDPKEGMISVSYKYFRKPDHFYIAKSDLYVDHYRSPEGKFSRYIVVPGIGIGGSVSFLKVCRFNAAVVLNGYLRFHTNSSHVLKGLFVGPELGLEFTLVRIKQLEVSLFSNMHIGIGYLNQDTQLERKELDGYGTLHTGIGLKF